LGRKIIPLNKELYVTCQKESPFPKMVYNYSLLVFKKGLYPTVGRKQRFWKFNVDSLCRYLLGRYLGWYLLVTPINIISRYQMLWYHPIPA